jgi:hypothetical protein
MEISLFIVRFVFVFSILMFWALVYLNPANASKARSLGIDVRGEYYVFVDTKDPRVTPRIVRTHYITKIGAISMIILAIAVLLSI